MKIPISVSIILALLAKGGVVERGGVMAIGRGGAPFPLHSPQPPTLARWPS